MSKDYIIGIDQSTQATKAILVDRNGHVAARCGLPHRQIINEAGWVEKPSLCGHGSSASITRSRIS